MSRYENSTSAPSSIAIVVVIDRFGLASLAGLVVAQRHHHIADGARKKKVDDFGDDTESQMRNTETDLTQDDPFTPQSEGAYQASSTAVNPIHPPRPTTMSGQTFLHVEGYLSSSQAHSDDASFVQEHERLFEEQSRKSGLVYTSL